MYNVKVIWKQENKLINADMEAPIKTKNGRYHRATRYINYTISQQVVSNPYVQQPNSSNIIKIIQFVAYRYEDTISSI